MRIVVGGTGGTIAMTHGIDNALAPTRSVQDLLAASPRLAEIADVSAVSLDRLPGASLTFTHLLRYFTWAADMVEEGADGVVLVQGTDTLEESAYLLDLLWSHDAPLVLTGAMRPAHDEGSDALSNLSTAIRTASTTACRGLGALVAMNGEVHAARRVRKTHTDGLDAFVSPNGGRLGHVRNGHIVLDGSVGRHTALPIPDARPQPRVALVEVTFGDDNSLLDAVAEIEVDGLVLSAFGVGHVPATTVDVLGSLAKKMPVVLSSRTGGGTTHTHTYGFPGSEKDLIARGLTPAGYLDSRKSRLLLWVLLAQHDVPDFRAEFQARGGNS